MKILFGLISDKSTTMHFNKILIIMSKATNTGIRGEDMKLINVKSSQLTGEVESRKGFTVLLFILQVEADKTIINILARVQ